MEPVKKNKHIKIVFTNHSLSLGRKTDVYAIFSRSSGQILGTVSWFSSWRQYCFDPNSGTVWSRSCLDLVVEFLKEVNKAHKS